MASHSFGTLFKVSTWGESHGKAIGALVDGCPSGLELEISDINEALALRAPGRHCTSPRKEPDQAEILSGVFEGQTTGTPISLIIRNQEADPSAYEPIKALLRPGHANYTYLKKYGIFDYRGGGRASARETACRVAAGAIAKKFLAKQKIVVAAYLKQVGPIEALIESSDANFLQASAGHSLFCPDPHAASNIIALLEAAQQEGDSWGGIVEFIACGVPPGIGDPVYEKLEANLARAMMSIPASKGFEMGSGFRCASMRGSEHNDRFIEASRGVKTESNHAGGTLGGISTGMPIVGRVAFKPASSILKPQKTLTLTGEEAILQLPAHSRHDPCVAIRAVPVVEAMVALVLTDALLLNRSSRISPCSN